VSIGRTGILSALGCGRSTGIVSVSNDESAFLEACCWGVEQPGKTEAMMQEINSSFKRGASMINPFFKDK
jgi:hypothetical protein